MISKSRTNSITHKKIDTKYLEKGSNIIGLGPSKNYHLSKNASKLPVISNCLQVFGGLIGTFSFLQFEKVLPFKIDPIYSGLLLAFSLLLISYSFFNDIFIEIKKANYVEGSNRLKNVLTVAIKGILCSSFSISAYEICKIFTSEKIAFGVAASESALVIMMFIISIFFKRKLNKINTYKISESVLVPQKDSNFTEPGI